MKICFDYGHGGRDPGATYQGRRESQDVLSIGQEIASYLRNQGVTVHETRTRDQTLLLHERTQLANKTTYDYFISLHRNAFRPEIGTGAETYIYLKGGAKAHNLAKDIQKALTQIGFKNRGVKRANYYVLRNTKAPALLLELGFVDNTSDNKLFDEQRAKIVEGVGKAILRAGMAGV